MEKRNNYTILFLAFTLFFFLKNLVIAQSSFPYQDFFTRTDTTNPVNIYFPDGKLKATGFPYFIYDISREFYGNPYIGRSYSNFRKIKNKDRAWKEYYENGQLKFTCIYPLRKIDHLIGRYNRMIDRRSNFMDHNYGFIINSIWSALLRNDDKLLDKIYAERICPLVTFYDTLGNKIAQGEMLFNPLLKINYWRYFDTNGIVRKEEFFNCCDNNKLPIEQLTIDSTVKIPNYYINLTKQDKNPYAYVGTQAFSFWQRYYNVENKLMYFRFNNNNFYSGDFNHYSYPNAIIGGWYDDNYSFKLNENGQLTYIKFAYPYMIIDSLTDRKIRCLKVKEESTEIRDESRQNSMRGFCNYCDPFIVSKAPDSCYFAFYEIFELFFNNDTISEAYGYYSEKKTENNKLNYDSDLSERFEKKINITTELKEIFTPTIIKDIYNYNQELMNKLFPENFQKHFYSQ